MTNFNTLISKVHSLKKLSQILFALRNKITSLKYYYYYYCCKTSQQSTSSVIQLAPNRVVNNLKLIRMPKIVYLLRMC